MSPFKSAGGVSSVDYWQPRCGISGSNVGCTMFRGSVKGTDHLLHSPVSPSLPLPYVIVCHHVLTGLYLLIAVQALAHEGPDCDPCGGPQNLFFRAERGITYWYINVILDEKWKWSIFYNSYLLLIKQSVKHIQEFMSLGSHYAF